MSIQYVHFVDDLYILEYTNIPPSPRHTTTRKLRSAIVIAALAAISTFPQQDYEVSTTDPKWLAKR